MIPYGRQDINRDDIEAVAEVLRSDFLTQGPAVPAFEKALGEYCGAAHAVAVNSATSALHIACLALDVGPGDIVWTSPTTFVASANCALYCGASVDFVDIDPQTYNLSPVRLEEKLRAAERTGRLPKVVIPVHFSGQPCDMAAIRALGERYGFRVIEDASHAIGARYQGEPVGNGRYSDITILSFHPVKIITTGEGGMALTNDAKLADSMRRLRTHGITSSPGLMEKRPEAEIWNYQQIGLGFNYRMTDIQGALGLSQFHRLEPFVARRRELAARYGALFAGLPLMLPFQDPAGFSSWHLYVVRLKPEARLRQKAFHQEMRARGILLNLHYIPVYLQPYYERLGFARGYCPEAERYFTETASLPLYPTLEERQQDQVVAAVRELLA